MIPPELIELFLKACGTITLIGGAAVYLAKVIKRLLKPVADIQDTLNEHTNYLLRDKTRLDALEKELQSNNESTNMILKSTVTILNHLQTGNCTGEMARVHKEIDNYLISSRR